MMKTMRTILMLAAAASCCQADLLVTNFAADSIVRFDNNGNFISQITDPLLDGPRGVTVGPDGNIYVANSGTQSVLRFNQAGNFLGVFASDGLDSVTDLVFGFDGDLFVGDFPGGDGVGGIFRFNGATGALIGQFDTSLLPAMQEPLALAFGNDSLYVTNLSGRLNRFDSTGIRTANFGGINTFGVTVGPDGRVYMSDNGPLEGVESFAANLTGGMDFIPDGQGGNGLTFGPDGNLYLTKGGGDNVTRYDGVTGAPIGVFASDNLEDPRYLTFFTPVPEPSTVALLAAPLLVGLYLRSRVRA